MRSWGLLQLLVLDIAGSEVSGEEGFVLVCMFVLLAAII